VKKLYLILAALAAVFILGFLGGRKATGSRLTFQTDTCIVRDTIVENKPIYIDRWRLRVDTVRLAVVKTDTVEVLRTDTVAVELPVEVRRYRGADYDLAVSGHSPELEWIKVFPATKIVTNTVEADRSRWSFGASAGPAVLVTPSGRVCGGVGVSAGVSYRF
jgi:hypothetical protein